MEPELCLRLWFGIQYLDPFGSPGSSLPCPALSPSPLLPCCKWLCSCTRNPTGEPICLKNDPVKNGYFYDTAGITREVYHDSFYFGRLMF